MAESRLLNPEEKIKALDVELANKSLIWYGSLPSELREELIIKAQDEKTYSILNKELQNLALQLSLANERIDNLLKLKDVDSARVGSLLDSMKRIRRIIHKNPPTVLKEIDWVAMNAIGDFLKVEHPSMGDRNTKDVPNAFC